MQARCYRHPDRDAVLECSFCGRLICEECVLFAEDSDEVLCPACSLDTAGDIIADQERVEEKRRRRAAHASAGRESGAEGPLVHRVYVLAFVLLALAAHGIAWFLDNGLEPVNLSNPEFDRYRNPAIEMTVVASKLMRYTADHGGELPRSLDDLFPGYIDREPRVLRGDVEYDFRPDPRGGFVLSCPQPTRYQFRRIELGGDGVLRVTKGDR